MTRQNTANAEQANSMANEAQPAGTKSQRAMERVPEAIGMKMESWKGGTRERSRT